MNVSNMTFENHRQASEEVVEQGKPKVERAELNIVHRMEKQDLDDASG